MKSKIGKQYKAVEVLWYRDHDYNNTHFKLLIEDFMYSSRKIIIDFLHNSKSLKNIPLFYQVFRRSTMNIHTIGRIKKFSIIGNSK